MPKTAKVGAPSKLTPELNQAFAESIALGMPVKYACDMHGINADTYHRWMKAGEKESEPKYVQFYESIKKAQSQFIAHNLTIIKNAAQAQWLPAAWLLERKAPSDFGRNQTKIKLELKNDCATDKALSLVDQVIDKVAGGELSLEDGKNVAALVEAQRRVLETIQIKERVDAIESKLSRAEAAIDR